MKKILIIKLRHHGDVLLSTALYKALNDLFPDVEVDTLIYKETSPLLENNPHLKKVWCIDRQVKGFARLKAEVNLIRELRRQGYDAVVHLTDQWIGALVARFSKAPKRVQMFYAKRNHFMWHRCFTDRITPPPRGQAHAVELNLLCLSAFGIKPSQIKGKMVLNPSADATRNALDKLSEAGLDENFILIHPAARWPFKCWDDEKFSTIVSKLLNEGLNVILTCSPDEVELAMTRHIESLARNKTTGSGVLINWGGSLSLPVLAALISKCRFYIGVDSAPMHMAAALDVPQIALFGPSWVQEWRPWSDHAHVIYAGDYGSLPHPDSINTDDPTRLLNAIPVEVVSHTVQELIKRTTPIQ